MTIPFDWIYPLVLLVFSNETINTHNYKIGTTVVINRPSDIRTLSVDANATRLINSANCPFARNPVYVYVNDLVHTLYAGLNGIHATLLSNEKVNYIKTKRLGECFKAKMTDHEIQTIQSSIDNDRDPTTLLLRIFLKRIYRKRKHVIDKLIQLREVDDELKVQIRKSKPLVPEYEVYTTMFFVRQPIFIHYVIKLYRGKHRYIDYPLVSNTIRFAAASGTIGDITINKGDTLLLNISHAVKKTSDKLFYFSNGTAFRKCQLAEFLDDFFTRIAC